jgi:hypothetical protein
LLPGGCYIVEDLYFHKEADAARHRGTASMGAQDYLLTFARRLMDSQAHPAHAPQAVSALAHSVDRIEAVGSAAFVWKKDPDPLGIDYEWLEILVQRRAAAGGRGAAGILNLFAGYILRTSGPLPTAERAARAALDVQGDVWTYQSTLAQILEKSGNLDEAAVWFGRASAIAPEPWRSELAAGRDRVVSGMARP